MNSATAKIFDTKKSVNRAKNALLRTESIGWALQSNGETFSWRNNMERVHLIRKGIPYSSIEVISARMQSPVKKVLDDIFDMPQTTYNKKKKEHSLLNGRDSETILLLTELLDFGSEVFNHEEEKFNRWLRKPNLSLGSIAPENLLDSATGIQEVKKCLNRIEYGNFA